MKRENSPSRLSSISPMPERLSYVPVLQDKSNNQKSSQNDTKKLVARTMKTNNLDVKNYQPLLSSRRGPSNVQ
jgi:hypothetical protein